MTDTCPICSTASATCALNSRYSGLICAACIEKSSMKALDGEYIKFGNVNHTGGFVCMVTNMDVWEKREPAQHFFELVDNETGAKTLCYADEHRFGGIVYTRASRTREEAVQIMADNEVRAREQAKQQREYMERTKDERERMARKLDRDPVVIARRAQAEAFLARPVSGTRPWTWRAGGW